jgi:hypothetical protein
MLTYIGILAYPIAIICLLSMEYLVKMAVRRGK